MAGIEVFGELRRYIPERTHVNRGKVIPRTMGRGLIAYDANYMPLAKLPKDLLITKRSNEGVEIVTGKSYALIKKRVLRRCMRCMNTISLKTLRTSCWSP